MTNAVFQPTLPLAYRSKTGRMPCPFCGSVKLSLVTYGDEQKPLLIQCNDCGATGPSQKDATEQELSNAWDIRAKII